MPGLINTKRFLRGHPLLILNVIPSFIQARAHEYVRGRKDLLDIEARLGVTRNLRGLRQSGYADVSYDFETLNADLAGLSKMVADNELSAATILEHAKALQRIVRICEMYEKPSRSRQDTDILSITSEQQEEIQSTITRAELYLKHMKFMQDVLQSLTAVLYNRIRQNDTRSMKTIAVVTLFCPSFNFGIINLLDWYLQLSCQRVCCQPTSCIILRMGVLAHLSAINTGCSRSMGLLVCLGKCMA